VVKRKNNKSRSWYEFLPRRRIAASRRLQIIEELFQGEADFVEYKIKLQMSSSNKHEVDLDGVLWDAVIQTRSMENLSYFSNNQTIQLCGPRYIPIGLDLEDVLADLKFVYKNCGEEELFADFEKNLLYFNGQYGKISKFAFFEKITVEYDGKEIRSASSKNEHSLALNSRQYSFGTQNESTNRKPL